MKRHILWMLLLCCAGVLSAQSYHIGDLYTAPDGSKGIVYYIHPDGSGGWVVALNDASEGCAWGDTTDVPGLTNDAPGFTNQNLSYYLNLLNDTAGYANTQALRSYQNNNTTYAAGKVDFAHGWVLPSPAQLRWLYRQLTFIAAAITNAGGTVLAYDWYWCSAEKNDSSAWNIHFCVSENCGNPHYATKITSCRVRAVRSFTNISVTYDTALSYQWNTGSTQPYINVNPAQTTTYTVTVTTDYGCSNTAEQTVIVGTGSAQTIYDTVCWGAGYEANGFSLTAEETQTAGTLTRTRTMTTSGCNSILTLRLWVRPTATSSREETAYRSYTWNGVTYYQSGDYTQHFNCVNGCDSTAVLHLTLLNHPILPPPEVSIATPNDTICVGNSVTLQAVIENAALFTPPPVPRIVPGDILCTDSSIVKPSAFAYSGKTALGIVFYVDSTEEHGWAVDLHDLPGEYHDYNYRWTTDSSLYVDIPTLNNYTSSLQAIADFDGYGNTGILRALDNAAQYPAAMAVDFDHGWYLPAMGQLVQMYAQLVVVNASLTLVGGTPFPLDDRTFYWSSTEVNRYRAWNLVYGGSPRNDHKSDWLYVRSVRSF